MNNLHLNYYSTWVNNCSYIFLLMHFYLFCIFEGNPAYWAVYGNRSYYHLVTFSSMTNTNADWQPGVGEGNLKLLLLLLSVSCIHNALVTFYRSAVIAYLLSSNYVFCGSACLTCSSCVNVNRYKEISYGYWLVLCRFLLSNPTHNGICHFINSVLFGSKEQDSLKS